MDEVPLKLTYSLPTSGDYLIHDMFLSQAILVNKGVICLRHKSNPIQVKGEYLGRQGESQSNGPCCQKKLCFAAFKQELHMLFIFLCILECFIPSQALRMCMQTAAVTTAEWYDHCSSLCCFVLII